MLKKVVLVTPASIFVVFDTKRYFLIKTSVMPISVCSATYCIPYASGDRNGDLQGISSF